MRFKIMCAALAFSVSFVLEGGEWTLSFRLYCGLGSSALPTPTCQTRLRTTTSLSYITPNRLQTNLSRTTPYRFHQTPRGTLSTAARDGHQHHACSRMAQQPSIVCMKLLILPTALSNPTPRLFPTLSQPTCLATAGNLPFFLPMLFTENVEAIDQDGSQELQPCHHFFQRRTLTVITTLRHHQKRTPA